MVVRRIKEALLDFFFPQVTCMVCGSAEHVKNGVCAKCRGEMERYPLKDVCAICGKPVDEREICPTCRAEKPTYTAARAVYIYHGATRKLVQKMKFRGEYELPVRVFGESMAEVLQELNWHADCILEVPSTARTKRKRGYNQAEKLARRVSALTGIRAEKDVLRKKRGTRSQIGLGAQERRLNLRGSILPGKGIGRVKDKRVLLIDDIYTTGSTAEECAKVLRKYGAAEVCVLCVARVAESALERYLAGDRKCVEG